MLAAQSTHDVVGNEAQMTPHYKCQHLLDKILANSMNESGNLFIVNRSSHETQLSWLKAGKKWIAGKDRASEVN